MICKKCGAEFDGAFCPKCGERAEEKLTVCPVCGKERAEGENFCSKCGYAFEGQAPAAQKPRAKITFDKEALLNGVSKFYKVALNIGKVFFSLLLFLILASPIMLHEGINTAGSGYTNAFNLYVDGRFTAVCALLAIIAFYSLIYAVFRCVRYFVFHNGKEGKLDRIAYFALNLAVFILCCIGCSGAGEWFADAGAGLSFGIFVGIVGMALSVLRYLFEDKFVNSDEAQTVEVSDDVKAVEKKMTKKVKLGTAVVTGALVIAVIITSIVQGVYTNPFSSASYGFAETRADIIKQFGMPENAKEDSSSYTYYSTEYAAAERMINALIAAQDKQLTDGFESDADSFDEDDLESMFDGVAGIEGIIEKLEEKQDNIKYKKSIVTFNNDGGENRNNDTVKSYVCEVVTPEVEGEEKTERTLKKLDVIEGVYEEYGYSAQIKYVAKYSDGSFSGDILTLNSDNYDTNKNEYIFSDVLGSYSVSIQKLNKMKFDYDGFAVMGNTLYIRKNYHGGGEIRPEGDYSDKDITRIVILQGVTSVSSYEAFDAFPNVNEIIVPDSLTYLNPNTIKNTAYYKDTSNWEDGNILYIDNLLVEVKEDINENYTVRSGTTAINENAFSGMANLKSITIPDSVTYIGENAFKDCKIINANIPAFALDYISTSELKTVVINSGNRFGDDAFRNCNSLTSIVIPDSVTSIGSSAFRNCSSLTSITIPDSVTSIGDYAFSECNSLTSITIPDSVTSIGYKAFEDCSSLASITIPDSVTSIGDYAFDGCSLLTSITIPDSVTSIGNDAFDGCSSLTSITIPDSVTTIGDYTFYDCSSLTSITIPDSVTSIGYKAFYGCSSLTSITIPDSVTSIGSYAFGDCSSLTSITIPDSVTSIGSSAFSGCSIITANIPTNAISVIRKSTLQTVIINSGENIGSSAFSGCSSLTSITIPDSVTSIGEGAFYDCRSLTSITIPDSVTSIGDWAFYYCSSLTSITIPDSVTSIGEGAFFGCSSLASITIPDSVTSIGSSAFHDCRSLTSITIPDSVTTIGDWAFYYCSSLTSVNFGENSQLESIGSYAFYDCSSLTRITIPDSVTSIGSYAFGCYNNSLTSVIFENTQGWWWYSNSSDATSGTSISSSDLADPATAAKYLTDTYCHYSWKRG